MIEINLSHVFAITIGLAWLSSFVASIGMTVRAHWFPSCSPLKITVAIWIAVTAGQTVLTFTSQPWNLFPYGFTWFQGFANLAAAVVPTFLLWQCNQALRELFQRNNRRASKLLDGGRVNGSGNERTA